MVMHASPKRKLYIEPAKDYSTPLNVDTSVEYDLPAHLYPPKGSQPILMIHPRLVATPSPTAMLATSGATRTLAPLQQQQAPLINTSSMNASQSTRSMCPCGNPNCNTSTAKSISVGNVRNMKIVRHVKSLANITNVPSVWSFNYSGAAVTNNRVKYSSKKLKKPRQERNITMTVPHYQYINSSVLQQSPALMGGTSTTASTTNTTQQSVRATATDGWCRGACCNPKPAAIAQTQAKIVIPSLPPSLIAGTATRNNAGGSPKIKGARSRRGLSVASSVHIPDYLTMGTNRSTRVPSRVEPLVTTPAPPMAHQNMTSSFNTSLDFASLAHTLTPKALFSSQQPSNVRLPTTMVPTSTMGLSFGSTSPLLVDLSRDSGCSTGGDYPLDFTSDKHRGLVDSGFSTPVDTPVSDDFITDMLSLSNWKESTTSYTPVINSVPTSSMLSGASSNRHYLPQPLWNLVY